MSAVRLSEAGNAYVTKAPPWSKDLFKLGRLGYPPGTLPPQLVPYLFTKGGTPAECARETANLTGANRVQSMNVCVARKRGRGGGAARRTTYTPGT